MLSVKCRLCLQKELSKEGQERMAQFGGIMDSFSDSVGLGVDLNDTQLSNKCLLSWQ